MKIIGTSPEYIDLAEDRKRFGKLLDELDIPQAPGAMAASLEEAVAGAAKIGYPCWFVLRMCSAAAPWSSPTTKKLSFAT